jgi:hypothetical protein
VLSILNRADPGILFPELCHQLIVTTTALIFLQPQ